MAILLVEKKDTNEERLQKVEHAAKRKSKEKKGNQDKEAGQRLQVRGMRTRLYKPTKHTLNVMLQDKWHLGTSFRF
jgi:hypothetical protein